MSGGSQGETADLELIKLLVARGASVKDEKKILFNHLSDSIIRYLLDNGADINEQDEDGNTILTYWEVDTDLSGMKYYLKLGANPYLKNKHGKNAFDAVRENKLLSTELYDAYIPKEKHYVALHRGLKTSEKRKAIELMKKYGAKFSQTKSD